MRSIGKSAVLCYVILMCLSVTSCVNTKKVVYFNNIQDTIIQASGADIESVIQKNDLLNITVSSLNPQASLIFNISNQSMSSAPALNAAAGTLPTSSSAGSGSAMMGYLVADDGMIKFPVLGATKAAGFTKKQLEQEIATMLTDQKLLIDPIVNVRFLNFRVTVLGEVARPTTINVSNERISILEALGLAGDLTIYGKRDNVLLIREDANKKIIKRIDLNSEKVLSSPYYYLKTNDILYVEPNSAKVASTNRTQQLLPIVLSALSFIAIIISYSIKHN
jgi:polysaccharide export outer membrane protein